MNINRIAESDGGGKESVNINTSHLSGTLFAGQELFQALCIHNLILSILQPPEVGTKSPVLQMRKGSLAVLRSLWPRLEKEFNLTLAPSLIGAA